MLILGLTGSIGMGKSTAAALFAARGVPLYDADKAVHDLYRGKAVELIEAAFPGVVRDREVDRALLAARVLDRDALTRLERIVHPLVRESQTEFLQAQKSAGRRVVLVDVPLLFETGGLDSVDVVVVVTAAPEIQRSRVLTRRGMTDAKLKALLARQMPDAEKRRRAHFIIDSSGSFADGARQVDAILRALSFTA